MCRRTGDGWIGWIALAVAGAALALWSARRGSQTEVPPPVLRLDWNRAPVEALLALPGVGEARARALVQHRPYADWSDLERRVPGVGPKSVAAWSPYGHFGAEAAPGDGEVRP